MSLAPQPKRTMLVINISVRPDDFISPGYGDSTIRTPVPEGTRIDWRERLVAEVSEAISDLLARQSVVDATND